MSSIDVKHFCNEVSTLVKWKIEDFLTKLPKEKETSLHSPIFSLYKSRIRFYIRFDTTSSVERCKDCVGLFLFPKNLDGEKAVDMKWKFWIENEDEKKIGAQQELSYKFEGNKNLGWGRLAFLKHADLYPPESDFIKNDTIYVYCKIVQNESQEFFKPIPLNDVEILKSYYKKSSDNTNNKGKLTIQMKNKTLKVKKALLALKSSVFQQMLQNQSFSETQNDLIKIDDFAPEVMEAFVEFMHLEYITQENVKHAYELLKLADKYNVIKLKEECTQILTKILNKDNIFTLLKTCFMHDCPKLREAVLDYVSRDDSDANFKDIMKTEHWKKFALISGPVSDEIVDAVFTRVQWIKTNQNGEVPSTSSAS